MKKLMRNKHNYAVKLQNEKEHLLSLLTEALPSRYNPEETTCFLSWILPSQSKGGQVNGTHQKPL